MTTIDHHPHGVPGWIDLATPDPAAARSFYTALFGWEYDEQPTDRPGVTYTMARRDGHAAAGMMLLSEEMAAAGMPPVWSTYVSVRDVDAAVAAVGPAGGTVLQPPMDVMDSGRMAVVNDPSGATLGLWQARAHIGAEVVNEHGALIWTELITPDPSAVAAFYAAVFGWRVETAPMPTGDYTVFFVEGGSEGGVAGAMAPPMPGMPTFWGVYFAVDDVAAAVERARQLGAKVLMEPTAMPGVGTLATLADPQGAVFSVMTPESTGA